eukprot:COSAG06_NODE_62_length_27058_cov_17.867725_20_plen_85_part_00
MRLDERRASRAACLSCGLCAQLTWASRYLCTMRAGELGRRKITAGEDGHSSPARNLPERQFGRGCMVRAPRSLDSGHCELAVHY